MSTSNKNVLIVGGSGFIGRNISEYLKKLGYRVGILTIIAEDAEPGFEYIVRDAYEITDFDEMIAGYDVVINAISLINPTNYKEKYREAYAKDIELNIRLSESIAKTDKKYIFISSAGAIYGNTPSSQLNEDSCCRPINFYGSLKLSIENMCHVFNTMTGRIQFISVRIANAFGPYQNYQRGVGFIDAAVKAALNHQTLYVYGDGSIVRDYIYTTDICYLIEKIIADNNTHEIYNISTNVGASQNDIIEIIRGHGLDLSVVHTDKRVGDIARAVVSNEIVRKEYGFSPMSLSDSIAEYIRYLQAEGERNN